MSTPTSYLQSTYLAFNSSGIGTSGTLNSKMVGSTGSFSFYNTDSVSTAYLRNVTDPVLNQDAATKAYVDSLVVAGVTWKNAVYLATTTNLASLSGSQTIDSVGVTIPSRVLIKNQTAGTQNGIYITNAGAWTRATDMANGTSAGGDAMFVMMGATNADTAWVCTNDPPTDIVGTDALTFVQFSSAPAAAGANTQIQYNNSGSFGASPNFTYTGTTVYDGLATASTNTTTGALQVVGGVGIGGSIYTGSSINSGTTVVAATSVSAGTSVSATTTVTGGTGVVATTGNITATAGDVVANNNVSATTGSVSAGTSVSATTTVTAGTGVNATTGNITAIAGNVVASSAGSQILAQGTTNSINGSTGALVVSGGVGIAKDLNVDGSVIFNKTIDSTGSTIGSLITFGGLGVAKSATIGNTTTTTYLTTGTGLVSSATDTTSATTGAFQVVGGVGIGKALFVGSTTNSVSVSTGAVVVAGGIGAAGDITANQFNATSDIQFKTNIEHLEDPLKTIKSIEGYSYNWKTEYSGFNDKKQFGVLAQQLESVHLDHLVSGSNTKSVNYLGLIPIIIEAVKELSDKIDVLVERFEEQQE